MKNLKFFFIFCFFLKNSNSTFIEDTGSYLSKVVKQFKNGYYNDEIKTKKDEISMRLEIIKKIFETSISVDELNIIISYYQKYVENNNGEYTNYLLNDENFKKIIEKLNLAISSKDFYIFFNN